MSGAFIRNTVRNRIWDAWAWVDDRRFLGCHRVMASTNSRRRPFTWLASMSVRSNALAARSLCADAEESIAEDRLQKTRLETLIAQREGQPWG
jgi:hypothetical protein